MTQKTFQLFLCLLLQDMEQQLSVARMRIVQLTAEVQSSKQAAQHHEEKTAALQAQVNSDLGQYRVACLRNATGNAVLTGLWCHCVCCQ